MKLRIKGNSIRLRLSQSDLDAFVDHGSIAESTTFPGGRSLVYAIEKSADVDELTPRFDGDRLSVQVPQKWATNWIETDRVGFDETIHLDDGNELTILVEKDFKCLHKRPEDEDAFPHPMANQKLVP